VAVAVATSAGDLHNRTFATGGETARLTRLQQRLSRPLRTHGATGDRSAATRYAPNSAGSTPASGPAGTPGSNVAQKAGLNRAILGKGWGGFLLALEHASRYHGATVVKVNRAYTSQTCHSCKSVAEENRESQAVFRCVTCGHQAHADVNAAKNILAAGLAVNGRGDLTAGRSTKRQPPERLAA
jgi:putative transposase